MAKIGVYKIAKKLGTNRVKSKEEIEKIRSARLGRKVILIHYDKNLNSQEIIFKSMKQCSLYISKNFIKNYNLKLI
jgi:hypothetical protein